MQYLRPTSERTVTEKFDESNAIKRLVTTTLKDQKIKKEYTRIKKRLERVVNPVEVVNNEVINILGICDRGNNQNVKTFERLMNEMYDTNLQY